MLGAWPQGQSTLDMSRSWLWLTVPAHNILPGPLQFIFSSQPLKWLPQTTLSRSPWASLPVSSAFQAMDRVSCPVLCVIR